jgi:hypothetical protein
VKNKWRNKMRINNISQLNEELRHHVYDMTPENRKTTRQLVSQLLAAGMEVDVDFYHHF